jgi:hypothetical protein
VTNDIDPLATALYVRTGDLLKQYPDLAARTAGDLPPAQVVADAALGLFLAGSTPITDADAEPSPLPPPGAFAWSR